MHKKFVRWDCKKSIILVFRNKKMLPLKYRR